MTRETLVKTPAYNISGTGPYTVQDPYRALEDLIIDVVLDGAATRLPIEEYSVTPLQSDTTGDVYLSAGAAAAYDGGTLYIVRRTQQEQGWEGKTAREKGLEAQLDILTMGVQDVGNDLSRSIRIAGATDEDTVIAVEEGRTLVGGGPGAPALVPGPTVGEIQGAEGFAGAAGSSASAAAGSAAAAAASAASVAPSFATIALMAAFDGATDGQSVTVSAGFNGEAWGFTYDAASTLTADGALVVDATGMGVGRWIGSRTVYADFAELDADVRTFADGTRLHIPGLGEYSTVSSGESFTTTGGVKLKVLPEPDGLLNAAAFGLAGDGVTDDITALNLWADAMRDDGREGRLVGLFATSAELDLKDTRIYAEAVIYPTGSIEAVTWKAASGSLYQYQACIGSLRVEWDTADWTMDRTAFVLQNSYSGQFDLGWAKATRGLHMIGDGPSGVGCVYNDIRLSTCNQHNLGIHLDAANANGWCNANTFLGGRFYGSGSVAGSLYETVAGHIFIDDTNGYEHNGNQFMQNSLEWNGTGFQLARMRGIRNRLVPRYCELDSGDTTWISDVGTSNVIDCLGLPYMIGYDPSLAGSANRVDVSTATAPIVLGVQGYMDGGGTLQQQWRTNSASRVTGTFVNEGSGPSIAARNEASGGNVALEVQKPDGTQGVGIPAAGAWTVFNGAKKLHWSQAVAPTTGTWARGDVVFFTNPSPGGYVGAVCTAGGTPGTWKSFGEIVV